MVYQLGHGLRDQFKDNGNIRIDYINRRKEGAFSGDSSRKNPVYINNNNVNKFIGNIAKNYMETTEGENWTSDLINHLNTQFPTSIQVPKGYNDQKILPHELHNLIQQEIWDANPHQKAASSPTASHPPLPKWLNSPGVCHSNSLDPFRNSMNMGNNYYNPVPINVKSSAFFEGPVFEDYNQNVASTTISCDGMNFISPLGVRQADRDLITSPEQISSITACSYGDMISDTEAFDGRPALPGSGFHYSSGSSAENSFPQQPFHQGQYTSSIGTNQTACNMDIHSLLVDDMQPPYSNLCLVQQDFQDHPEAINILPNKFTNRRSDYWNFSQSQLQMPGAQQLNQWPHQSSVQFDEQLTAQSKLSFLGDDKWLKETAVQGAYKIPQFSSDISPKARHVPPENSSHVSSYYILSSYVMYKGMPAELRNEVPFQDYMHAAECKDYICNCPLYLELASHFDICNDLNCNACGPVRRSCSTNNFLLEPRKRKNDLSDAPCSWNSCSTGSRVDTLPPKRLKVESSVAFAEGFSQEFAASVNQQGPPDQLPVLEQWPEAGVLHEHVSEVKTKLLSTASDPCKDATDVNHQSNFSDARSEPKSTELEGSSDTTNDEVKHYRELSSDIVHLSSEERTSDEKVDSSQTWSKAGLANSGPAVCVSGLDSAKTMIPSVSLVDRDLVSESEKTKTQIASSGDNDSRLESGKIKKQSASLADVFTADQIKEHLASFTQHKDVSGNTTHSVGQNTCQLCSMDKLVFAPAPIYCSSCETRIKRNVGYFRSADEGGIQYCFCTSCFMGSRGPNILMRGLSICKANLHKAKNDEEKEDSWVLCDRCQRWQHRICGLYNDERDAEGKAEYVCPKCCLEEIERGKRVPLPQAAAFGANDLPRTNLSDHIEQRLSRRLKQEKEEMAKISGMEPEEIPGAEGLVVRVVVAVDKQLKVKQQFIDILHGEDYPAEFAYRSKLIFLFQKIEGVDVCLFGMCVQEFGSECGGPNQRCIYISYLDSVKYFRPERECVTGESLRTFVYHEILIGYLEYCKKRGFTTCYIWACPLIKGEDYIFYCHPETQKTPKQDKLRRWYQSMLKKAAEEDVVVDHTNLYNEFFVTSQGNTKITAARLPYFDGDYWSGTAESIVTKLEQEESPGGLRSKKPNKRTLKAMGQDNPDVAAKDVLVMQKLGQAILHVKENFMLVRLQYICTHCHEVILSGSRWFCSQCKKIQLCSRCFHAAQRLPGNGMHKCHSCDNNQLSEVSQAPKEPPSWSFVVVNNVIPDTKDKDPELINSFFETRDAFLNKCQKSLFQFDTLGRAKYSSMMILYHLMHKPTIGPTCSVCHKDVLVEQCWHCGICTKHYVCEACYEMKGTACHAHKLTKPSTEVITRTESKQPQKQNMLTSNMVLDALIHASQCKSIPCSYPVCNKIRKLFHHAAICHVKLPGGCKFCQRVWLILKGHSQNCRDSSCQIPRCMDIKKHTEMRASCPHIKQNAMEDQQGRPQVVDT